LEEAAYSALSKGLNYAVAPRFILVKGILCGVEKVIRILPEGNAEEIRILKYSRQPKSNPTGAEGDPPPRGPPPRFILVKDILCDVEKVIRILPEGNADEIRQETIRILKYSRQPESNLTGAERRVLRSLKANGKCNAAVVLGTSDYNRKIATLLEDKAYEKLKKDPTHSIT
jgi:hypothetical protein